MVLFGISSFVPSASCADAIKCLAFFLHHPSFLRLASGERQAASELPWLDLHYSFVGDIKHAGASPWYWRITSFLSPYACLLCPGTESDLASALRTIARTIFTSSDPVSVKRAQLRMDRLLHCLHPTDRRLCI